MTDFSKALAVVLPLSAAIAAPTLAKAQDQQAAPQGSADKSYPAAPTFGIQGEITSLWTDNVFSDKSRIGDFLAGVRNLQITAKGDLAPDISYTFYGGTGSIDRYFRKVTGDNSATAVGVNVEKTLLDIYTFGLTYENDVYFKGVYHNKSFMAHDFLAYASGKFAFDERGSTLTPHLTFGYQLADDPTQEYFSIDVKVDIVKNLDVEKKWSIVSQPEVTFLAYDHGINSGRRDVIATASLGIRYAWSDSLNLTTSVGYQVLRSNLSENNFERLVVGPHLNFSLP